MIMDGGRCIATAGGAMLAVAAGIGVLLTPPGSKSSSRNLARAAATRCSGLGAVAWLIARAATLGAAPLSTRRLDRVSLADRYTWAANPRPRVSEWRCSRQSRPAPAGAAADRRALSSPRHDVSLRLITRLIPDADPLSSRLAAGRGQGRLRRWSGDRALHGEGVDHAD